jgi:hypothetical protein
MIAVVSRGGARGGPMSWAHLANRQQDHITIFTRPCAYVSILKLSESVSILVTRIDGFGIERNAAVECRVGCCPIVMAEEELTRSGSA